MPEQKFWIQISMLSRLLHFFSISPSLGDGRYRLKYCHKVLLKNPNNPRVHVAPFCYCYKANSNTINRDCIAPQAPEAGTVFFANCSCVLGYQVGPYKDLCPNLQLTKYKKKIAPPFNDYISAQFIVTLSGVVLILVYQSPCSHMASKLRRINSYMT